MENIKVMAASNIHFFGTFRPVQSRLTGFLTVVMLINILCEHKEVNTRLLLDGTF